ncbi:hypothetical protein KCP74_05700 [Salmonella enterica subsp. enterica]|nr:hypothetical protein KCP74_05700 [Salmonella enterica subsp. enterica]
MPADIVARVLAVGMVCAGFLAFILPPARVRPHAAGLSDWRARPEPAAAGPGLILPRRCFCTWAMSASRWPSPSPSRAAERASGLRVRPFCPPVDAGGVGDF